MTEHAAEVTMKAVRPYWPTSPGRVTAIESSATEALRTSGLIVATTYDGDDGIKRGVVLDVTGVDPMIESGTVIFYRQGVRIGDVVVVNLVDVLAYEVSLD